jgi:hypothetical protein
MGFIAFRHAHFLDIPGAPEHNHSTGQPDRTGLSLAIARHTAYASVLSAWRSMVKECSPTEARNAAKDLGGPLSSKQKVSDSRYARQ